MLFHMGNVTKLRLLDGRIWLDYLDLGGPNLITFILKSRELPLAVVRDRWWQRQVRETTNIANFGDGGKGLEPKDADSLQESEMVRKEILS